MSRMIRQSKQNLFWLKKEGFTPFEIITIVFSFAALIVQILK